jgi:hypothetical protein
VQALYPIQSTVIEAHNQLYEEVMRLVVISQ